VFTETIYGVQKKLYTEWTPFVDLLLSNIPQEDDEYSAWHANLFRFTMVNLFSKLNSDSITDLTKYIVDKVVEEWFDSPNKNAFKLEC